MAMAVVVVMVAGCDKSQPSPSKPASSGSVSAPAEAKPVSALILLDLGAKINVPTTEILKEMEVRGLRPATDSEVLEWLKAGHEIPTGVIVVAELDRPETVGVLKRQMAPGFMWDKKTGRVVKLSIDVPATPSTTENGWFTANYRFAAVPK